MTERNITLEDLKNSTIKKKDDGLNQYKQDSNVFLQAIKNVPSSAKKFVKDVVTPFLSPIQTAKDIGALGSSVVSLIRPGEQGNEQIAREVGNFFKQRYGSLENIKKTFATDPVGMLSDVSIILTGGAMASTKAPQLASLTKTLTKASNITDPLKIGGKGASLVGEIPTQIFGATTGAGSKAIKEAVEAGAEGGKRQEAFREGMRGEDIEGVVDQAYASIKELNEAKSKTYKDGVSGLQLSQTKIDFNKVDDVINKYKQKLTIGSKGKLKLNENSLNKLKEVEDLVDSYRKDPSLHTAEGLDFLKQEIDSLYPPGINVGQPGTVVSEIRKGVYNLILDEVPQYGTIMKAYEKAIKSQKTVMKELGLGKNVATGTTLKKLQQAVKDNQASNFGQRAEIIENLNPDIMPKLAGSALSSYVPRGLQGAIAGGGQLPFMAYQVMQGANPLAFAPGLLAQSPKVVGNIANVYGMGKGLARKVPFSAISKVSRPIGLISNEVQNNQALQNRGLL